MIGQINNVLLLILKNEVIFMRAQPANEVIDIFVYQVMVQKVLREINEPDLSLRDKIIILSTALNHLKDIRDEILV
jgi:hypothetical protein